MAFQVLNPSFRIEWPVNSKEITEKVHEQLKEIAAPIRSTSKFGKRRKRKEHERKKRENDAERSIDHQQQKIPFPIDDRRMEMSDSVVSIEELSSMESGQDEKKKIFKENFILGVASILRHLEQQKLSVVFFDPNLLRPSPISQFIGAASVESGAHCVCLDGLSERLSPILNLKSVAALGIKRSDDVPESIASLVSTVTNSTKCVVSGDLHGDDDKSTGRKRKRKKQAAGTTAPGTPYVEATVTVRKAKKKK